jgi:hypothetical protein
MIGLSKRPRNARKRGASGPAALFVILALALSGCTPPTQAAPPPDKAVTASMPDGADVSVVFPGHSDIQAKVEPRTVTAEMEAAAPSSAAHISNLADFSITEGNFPDSGAKVTFTRKTPPPSGALSVIVHWNEKAKTWEPVKTQQSEDRMTLTATVAHFSSYSIMDFFRDVNAIYQGGRVQADGWAAEKDTEAPGRLVNGTAQWFGVQAAPPVCDSTPKPGWAQVLGQSDITSIITSCASGSSEHRDNLVVKVTVNRSYAGYFTTAAEPVSAEQDGFDVKDDHDPAVVADTFGKHYFDWKTVGAMMVNSGLMSPGDTSAGVYPAMPFATYTFEFTKQDVLVAWPRIKAQNKELVGFDTEWQLALAGLLTGVVDAAVVNDDGKGKIAFVVVALQVNDCFRSFNVSVKDKGVIPSADNLLSIINCVTVVTTDQAEALGKRAGFNMEDRMINDKTAKETIFEPILKATRKVFAVVAGVEIGATLGTAINDLTLADPVDRNLYFNPNGDAVDVFNAGPWTWHTTSDRAYQFLIPADWKVTPGPKRDYLLTGDNALVVNDKGQTMSEFVSGTRLPDDMVVYGAQIDTFDSAVVSGLKPVWEESENALVYQGLKVAGGPWNAFIGVSSYRISDTARIGAWGFVSSVAPPITRMGGSFGRTIKEDTALADVSPRLTGTERLRAYMATVEYQKIRTMLASLRDYSTAAG